MSRWSRSYTCTECGVTTWNGVLCKKCEPKTRAEWDAFWDRRWTWLLQSARPPRSSNDSEAP